MAISLLRMKIEFVHTLRGLDFETMPISRYNKDYIHRMMPNIEYYIDIYNKCLLMMSNSIKIPFREIVMVDYGGGHGFLSMYVRKMGIGSVIYVDKNPNSVYTAKHLKEITGLGPDIAICGDENDLIKYCDDNGITPNLLIGIDVIEHIYNVEKYLKALIVKWPYLEHFYATGSTPYNPLVRWRLHRLMKIDEYGNRKKTGYLELRRQYVARNYPDMSTKEVDIVARETRGLTYEDIDLYLQHKQRLSPIDPYNTCDPATGNWTERILTYEEYTNILRKYGYEMIENFGFYNSNCKGPKLWCVKLLNRCTQHIFRGKYVAPFLILWLKQFYLKESSEEDLEVAKTHSEDAILLQVKKRQDEFVRSIFQNNKLINND